MMIGTSVDRYKIVEELGHGGMSVVYRGVDSALERDVAVKVLHNHLARRVESRQRFHREAKAIARLKHPNILSVYDFSAADSEQSYIVMEYICGKNLREFLGEFGPAPPEAAALVGIGLAEALACAHEHGIIHRDLKPENVMVSNQGELKLMDFGIAHVIDAETMTQTGSLLGSPAHMAPEMIEGERADERADVFALGTVLYWLATGSLPYDGANAPQVLKRVLSGEHEPVEEREPTVGVELGRVIERCMAHNADDRYPSVRDVLRELHTFVEACGFDDVVLELRRYLKDPTLWASKHHEMIVDSLSTRANTALSAGDVPTALGLLNRILAYEPDNLEVTKTLKRIHRVHNGQRYLLVGLVLVVLGIIAYSVFSAISEPEVIPQEVVTPEPLPIEPVRDLATEELELARAQSEAESFGIILANHLKTEAQTLAEVPKLMAIPLRPIAEPITAIIVEEPEQPEETEPVEPQLFTHQFRLSPPAAELNALGRTFSSLEAARGIEFPVGKHLVTVSSRGCKSLKEYVNVSGPQAERRDIVLTWEDGVVNVSADVDSIIFLGNDTRNVSRRLSARKASTFRFPFGDADQESTKTVAFHIAPSSDMTRRKTYSVTVRPGMTETLNVAFGQN